MSSPRTFVELTHYTQVRDLEHLKELANHEVCIKTTDTFIDGGPARLHCHLTYNLYGDERWQVRSGDDEKDYYTSKGLVDYTWLGMALEQGTVWVESYGSIPCLEFLQITVEQYSERIGYVLQQENTQLIRWSTPLGQDELLIDPGHIIADFTLADGTTIFMGDDKVNIHFAPIEWTGSYSGKSTGVAIPDDNTLSMLPDSELMTFSYHPDHNGGSASEEQKEKKMDLQALDEKLTTQVLNMENGDCNPAIHLEKHVRGDGAFIYELGVLGQETGYTSEFDTLEAALVQAVKEVGWFTDKPGQRKVPLEPNQDPFITEDMVRED
jgi:hypothetical protein